MRRPCLIERLECREADVLQDGNYDFSIRLGENGIWCIFKRYPEPGGNVIQAFG